LKEKKKKGKRFGEKKKDIERNRFKKKWKIFEKKESEKK
jgi:hypothetical protein